MNWVPERANLLIMVAVVTGLGLGSPNYVHGTGTGIVAEQNTTQASQPTEKRAVPGICEREAERLLGQKPVRIDRLVRAPKKTRDVRPKYPELPLGTTGRGMWIGEVLINSSGKIAHVWPIREVEISPPFSSFNDAISDAIQRWEYEPLLVHGKAAPLCVTVTVNINWS